LIHEETMTDLRFDGKVALVTGAGRGVGRAHALLLASRGAKVIVVDPGVGVDGSGGSSAPADEVAREIQAAGGQAVACYESVAEESGATAMVKAALDAFGRLDVVINNAGINGPQLFENHSTDDFLRMAQVNYLGTVNVCRAAWKHFMKSGGGRIVNTASEGPLGIHEMMTAYGGAKGGVIGLTLALASEGPKYGIAVNGFSPRVGTRMSSPEVMSHVYGRPAEAFAKLSTIFPPELASPAAVYLAHESCPLNGVMLCCGGGQVLRMAIMQNEGVTDENLTMEVIAARLSQVIDMSDAANVGIGARESEVRTPKLAGGNKSSLDSIS
jgi:NAD(P)-dependent dehydrogenase (short-subunit alcohol dehydrogenase family)